MNYTGTIAGIESAFGARWDDAKDKARMKAMVSGTVGYYDDKGITKKMHPAPSVVRQMIKVDDALAAYCVFFHDDEGEIFGSVVFSSGQIAPMSETIYEDAEDWSSAITRYTNDSNVDQVYLPENAVDYAHEKHQHYDLSAHVDTADLAPIKSASNVGTVLIMLVMLLILAAIPLGAWIWIAKPFEKTTSEAQFVVEKIKPDYSGILTNCMDDLSDPWPAPPEWTLSQEGCVTAPDLAKIAFAKPADQRPYAYRFYELDESTWDDFLSRASFLKMAERFPGQVLEGTNEFVLYMPYDLERNVVDDAYTPDTNPVEILRKSFVGAVRIGSNAGVGGTTAQTDLELKRTVDRLIDKRLTAAHVYRKLQGQQTGMDVSPERIETRQVRVK